MTRIYTEKDTSLSAIAGKRVAILGYGSQGHAHALNLKDSGVDVTVGLYDGSPSRAAAEAAGLRVATVREAAEGADLIAFLIPDTRQSKVFADDVATAMAPGTTLLFAHGFNIHYHQIQPPASSDVILVAPKTPGHRLRELYAAGGGAPALFAIHQDASGAARETALSYARGIGCTRAGVIETTFAEETETDLFGEQAVICGGVAALIQAGFETLVEAGYQPEIAYFECLHEMKLIVDLVAEGGLEYMRHSISDTAEYGDYTRGPRIVDDRTRAEMRRVLSEIQNGTFAREWVLENQAGRPAYLALQRIAATGPLAETGKRLRELMARARS